MTQKIQEDAASQINFFANDIQEKKEAQEKLIAQKKARFKDQVRKWMPYFLTTTLLVVGVPWAMHSYNAHEREEALIAKIAHNEQLDAGVQNARQALGSHYAAIEKQMKTFGITSLVYAHSNQGYNITANFNNNTTNSFTVPLNEENLHLGYEDASYEITLEMVSYTRNNHTYEGMSASGISEINQAKGADVTMSNQKLIPEINHMIERSVDSYIFSLQPQYAQASFNANSLASFKQNLPAWFDAQGSRLEDKMLKMASQYAPFYKYEYLADNDKVQARQNYINTYNMLVNLGVTPKDDQICEIMTMPMERGMDTEFLKTVLKGKTTAMKCGSKSVIDYYVAGINHVTVNGNLDYSDSNGFYHDYNQSILYLDGPASDWKILESKLSMINPNEDVYMGNRKLSFDKQPLIQRITNGAENRINNNPVGQDE